MADASRGEPDVEGGSVLPRSDALVFITKRDDVHHKPATLQQADNRAVSWSLAGGTIHAMLERTSDASARLSIDGKARSFVLLLRPETDKRQRELDAIESRDHPPADICERAARCCPMAAADFHAQCDLGEELGVPPDPDICVRWLRAARARYDREGRPLPSACQP